MSSVQHLEPIVRRFFEFKSPLKATVIGSGNINDTYRVDFKIGQENQSWLLQRLNHQVFTDPHAVMHNIEYVAEHLSKQDDYPLQIPMPALGLDSQLLQRDDAGNFWRVFPFYEHSYVPEQLPKPAVAFEAAQAYGAFLYGLRDCPASMIRETIPGFHDTNRRWAIFQDVLENDPAGRMIHTQSEIETMYTAKAVFDTIGKLKSSGTLVSRITHNDTKAGNVLFDTRSDRAIAVIDWDTIMPGTSLSDFGDMVRTFATDRPEDDPGTPQLRLDALKRLCEGFLSRTAGFLSEKERHHLALGAPWIIGEQALRFLSDYLAGDVYYKTKYEDHNLVRARNQLAFFRTVQDNMPFLEDLLNP